MRHRVSTKIISRTSDVRRALIVGLTKEFIRNESLQTTLVKAKYIKPVLENMISLGRQPNLNNRRRLFARLGDARLVNKILNDIGPRLKNRSSGQIRIIKLGQRRGDGAPIASLEFVDHRPHD